MFCRTCGHSVSEGGNFCTRCGYPLPASREVLSHPERGQPAGDVHAEPARSTVPGYVSSAVSFRVTECQVVPGETARFPFVVNAPENTVSIHEFDIKSGNPNFDLEWARIVRSTGYNRGGLLYTLEIRPTEVDHRQYGTYQVYVFLGTSAVSQRAGARCALVIKPCVRLVAKPTFESKPAGVLSLLLENCGNSSVVVSVSITHHGSNWSKGWEFELQAEDGPFDFSETFNVPTGIRKGEFALDISAEGVPIIHLRIKAGRTPILNKAAIAIAVVLAGGAIVTAWAVASRNSALASQSIAFTSVPPAAPISGDTYVVTARGGTSGNPVIFTIDSSSDPLCSISGSTVTFEKRGNCMIDANQAGNQKYKPAPQAQQAITVKQSATPIPTPTPTTPTPTTPIPTTPIPTTPIPTTPIPTTPIPTTPTSTAIVVP